MSDSQGLKLFSETRFDHRVPRGLPASNPTVDLSVTWDAAGKNLLIYRPKDQVVSKIHQFAKRGDPAPEPQTVRWKPDGQFLAVGWSDGYVRLMGLENNKAAHHIRVSEDPEAKITHIGWSCNSVGRPGSRRRKTDSKSWHDLMSKEMDLPGNPAPLDLPRELTFLEVDSALPKISPLPTSSAGEGEDALVFTLRTGIEFLFQEFKTEDSDLVYVMVVGTSDGHLHLSIYDSFVIGDFKYALPKGNPESLHLIHQASHPEVSTHSLLLKPANGDNTAVYLVPMDLPFIPSSPINLALLASKLTTLQKLLRYVKQTQLHMLVEYKNTRELPTRFLAGVQEDLEKMVRGPADIVQALFHTVVTGHTYDIVQEWLVDNLAERGHKRWDKAVTSGLENLRALVHENLLPALERCAVILSRLRGLAQFYDTRDDIGFSVAQITRATDIVSCLTLVGHKILLNVMEELDLFTAFSSWMRFQIDRLAATNSASDELTEKEATMENGKVLAYIQRYLKASPMGIFFDDVSKEDYTADWDHAEDGPSLLDMLDAQLKRQEEGQSYMKAFPHVEFLVNYLSSRANGIFKDIAEAQKRSVRFGQPTRISLGRPIANMDAKMCATRRSDEVDGLTFTAFVAEGSEDIVYIFRTAIQIINGISSAVATTVCGISLGEGSITDLKFLGETTLVVLWSKQGQPATIITIPIRSNKLLYSPYEEGTLPPAKDLADTVPGSFSASLPDDPTFAPVQMEVQEATGVRGDIPARICLLGSSRSTYRVFSLPGGDRTPAPGQV